MMKSFTLLLAIAALLVVPAAAQIVYENGPINGNVDAWTINFGFVLADSFTISTGQTNVTGMSFGAWLFAGDTLQSAEVQITSEQLGGTIYFQGQIPFTQSGCVVNNYGFDVCTETASFNGPTLNNGMYWVDLQNAVSTQGNPVYWDENSGVGCHSPGCPSEAGENFESIPSEAFSMLGSSSSSTSTSVPEPDSLMLFASSILGLGALLRRKLG